MDPPGPTQCWNFPTFFLTLPYRVTTLFCFSTFVLKEVKSHLTGYRTCRQTDWLMDLGVGLVFENDMWEISHFFCFLFLNLSFVIIIFSASLLYSGTGDISRNCFQVSPLGNTYKILLLSTMSWAESSGTSKFGLNIVVRMLHKTMCLNKKRYS